MSFLRPEHPRRGIVNPGAARALASLLGLAAALQSSGAFGQDGSNDVCPAVSLDASDVRDRYDEHGRWVHQLRLSQGRVVEEIELTYRDDRVVERTELTPGHRRVARTHFDGERVVAAECFEDGHSVADARYHYDADGRLVRVDKATFAKVPAEGQPGTPVWTRETTLNTYDAEGQLVLVEVRDAAGRVKSRIASERPPPEVPIVLSLTSGGAYQSDTELYDFLGGIGIRRDPKPERYASDPLEVELAAAYRFHRAAGTTSTDQTTLRMAVDYHDILPRITLFSFMATDRNLPVNLRLNLELAVLGFKLDLVRRQKTRLDVSFAPIWNFRSIVAPEDAEDETTSRLRGSLRARAALNFDGWAFANTLELLPTLYGDHAAPENDFWHRTVFRDTMSFDIALSPRFTLRQIVRYTWDSAMRAQAECPDDDNPLCRGYAVSSTTALSLNLEL